MHSAAFESLRWLTESQRERLASVLAHACKVVTREWYCGTELPKFVMGDVQAGLELPVSGQLFEVISDAGRLMTIQLTSDWTRQILNLPTGSLSAGTPSTWVAGLERDFVEALARRIIPEVLAPGLSVQPIDQFTENRSRKYSRQTFCWVSACQSGYGRFALDGKLVDQLVPRTKHTAASAPSPRRIAIGEQSVVIRAHIGQADVSFSALQNLALGDVLVLESPLAEPISLRSENGQIIAVGNLGRQDQNRVIRLSNVAAKGQAVQVNAVKRSIQ